MNNYDQIGDEELEDVNQSYMKLKEEIDQPMPLNKND